jgi:hypothetical protein
MPVTDGSGRMRREVWLRGNLRPAAGLAALATLLGVGLVAAAIAAGLAVAVIAVCAAAACLLAAAGGYGLWMAARPRLTRAGDTLEAWLALSGPQRVPLEVVECIFRGSEPLPLPGRPAGQEDGPPKFRVNTLVVRLAERATDWQARETFRPWGTWEDGHLVVDGRWCEPLTTETVRGVAAKLLEAKREVAAGGGG